MNSENKFRTFFAIDMPLDVKNAIEAIMPELKNFYDPKSVRWVKPHSLHLTLQFLRDVASEDVPKICLAVKEALLQCPPFTLQLGKMYLFPHSRKPRVIALEVEVSNDLALLAHFIGKAIVSTGYPIENRPFRAHVTLARFNINTKRHPVVLPAIQPQFFSPISINEIIYFRSQPNSHTDHYSLLAKFDL